MNRKKSYIWCMCCLLLSGMFPFTLSALDMPGDSFLFNAFFGQSRGGVFSKGLVFAEKGIVRAVGSAKVLLTIDSLGGVNAFPSTLGNAVIAYHDEGLITTYANLADTHLIKENDMLSAGSVIAESGVSAWQPKAEGLHFLVSDTIAQTTVNPLLLLGRIEDTTLPTIKNINAISVQTGSSYVLGQTKSIPQGAYRIYGSVTDTTVVRGTELVPFYTMIAINGIEAEHIQYEIMTCRSGQLYLSGSKFFSFEHIYPSSDTVLLGMVHIPRGKNMVSITVRDINGNERVSSLSVEVF